jgi:hypothetical protein
MYFSQNIQPIFPQLIFILITVHSVSLWFTLICYFSHHHNERKCNKLSGSRIQGSTALTPKPSNGHDPEPIHFHPISTVYLLKIYIHVILPSPSCSSKSPFSRFLPLKFCMHSLSPLSKLLTQSISLLDFTTLKILGDIYNPLRSIKLIFCLLSIFYKEIWGLSLK